MRTKRAGAAGAWMAAAALAGVALLTACTPPPQPAPVETSAAPAPTPSASTPAPPPVLVPEGTAEQNLPYFTAIVEQVSASGAGTNGRAYVDALVAAGFDKATMQVTPDLTTIGDPVESLQFSVRWTDGCLIGQVGPATGEPATSAAPVLDGDVCLLGSTRAIDW